jgi:hypothetical protein
MALRPFMTQGVVPQTLLNSFTAGNAPQGGVAMTAPMTPRTMAASAAPAAAATQGPDSLAQMTRLLGGDLSGSLTSGDKLLALSGLLRSATRSGRRAGITPQQVIGQLQQQKVAEVQNRLKVEQLRREEAERRQQQTAMSNFVATLPPEKQALFPGLDAEGQQAMLKEHVSPQPFQIVKSGGEQFLTFRNKDIPPVKLDIPRDVETVEIDTGRSTQIRDKVTNEVILEVPKEMSTYQAAMLRLSERRENRMAAGGGSGGGGGGDGGGASGDGKVRTIVYTMPGRSAPQVGRGYVLPGGFVRPVDGPLAGKVVPQAKSTSSRSDTGGV